MTWTCQTCGTKTTKIDFKFLNSDYASGWCWECRGLRTHRAETSGVSEQANGPETFARNTDPDTSWEAARSVANIRSSQRFILNLLEQHGPMTDEEIAVFVKVDPNIIISPSGARTRRSELVNLGLVKDSGKRKRMSTGRKAIVWQAL